MTVPDALPSLSAGAHDADDGEACVMEYVSLLAGEQWSDRPETTHPILAHEARTANDLLLDHDRQRLVPLIGRLFGTTEDSPGLRAALRMAQARQVVTLLEPDSRGRAETALSRADQWLHGEGTGEPADAFTWAARLERVGAGLDPDHADFHLRASHLMRFLGSPEVEAAEAWASAAVVAAHVAAAAGSCRADCGDESARARRMVKDLAALVGVYDQVTGRTTSVVDTAGVRALIGAVR